MCFTIGPVNPGGPLSNSFTESFLKISIMLVTLLHEQDDDEPFRSKSSFDEKKKQENGAKIMIITHFPFVVCNDGAHYHNSDSLSSGNIFAML